MLGKHRHEPEDQRQFAIVAAGKVKAYHALGQHLRLGDLGVVGPKIRPALVAQQLPRKHDIGRGHLPAVGEFRRRIDCESHIASFGVGLHGVREQSVERERLVVTARHQALDHVAADLRQRQAFDDEGIEAVEGAEDAEGDAAAFGGRRIGVAQGLEIRRERRFAVHGDGMTRNSRFGRCGARGKERDKCNRQHGAERAPRTAVARRQARRKRHGGGQGPKLDHGRGRIEAVPAGRLWTAARRFVQSHDADAADGNALPRYDLPQKALSRH